MEIWELIGLVVLVAMFFGISFTAALHGIISFVFWCIVIGLGIWLLSKLFEPADTPVKPQKVQPKPQTVQPKPQKVQKKSEPTKVSKFFGKFAIFAVTYLLSMMFMVAIGLSEACIRYNVPTLIVLLIPALPYIVMLSINIIRKSWMRKKARQLSKPTR